MLRSSNQKHTRLPNGAFAFIQSILMVCKGGDFLGCRNDWSTATGRVNCTSSPSVVIAGCHCSVLSELATFSFKTLAQVGERFHFALIVYVVMPEHVHLLISEPGMGTPSKAVQVLKQRVSRQLRRTPRKRTSRPQMVLQFDSASNRLPHFWQRRFYDFNVWSRRKRNEKLHYMHMNPLRRRLVPHPRNWLWSSYAFHAGSEPAFVPIDR